MRARRAFTPAAVKAENNEDAPLWVNTASPISDSEQSFRYFSSSPYRKVVSATPCWMRISASTGVLVRISLLQVRKYASLKMPWELHF